MKLRCCVCGQPKPDGDLSVIDEDANRQIVKAWCKACVRKYHLEKAGGDEFLAARIFTLPRPVHETEPVDATEYSRRLLRE